MVVFLFETLFISVYLDISIMHIALIVFEQYFFEVGHYVIMTELCPFSWS